MPKKQSKSQPESEQKPYKSIKWILTYLKDSYTSHRDSFQEKVPFGVFFWDGLRVILLVALISSIVITVTGLTTPFVAVSSGSMEPNIVTGDLVIMTSPEGNPPLASTNSIATTDNEYATSFNEHGSVILFESDHNDIPVIHRVHYHTEKDENWLKNVDESKLPENVSCTDVKTCPAPHSGYITIGDNNPYYDQIKEYNIVTKKEIIGVAEYRLPYVGWLVIFR